MGLQIRVRHALGERVMELPDRTIDEPLTVGRSTIAEVQMPSVTVAPRHCVLFIHDGHWVVQDLGAGVGTLVNGRPVREATLLSIGDVITVGGANGSPTIEVDPLAAAEGRTGYAGSGLPHLQEPESAGYSAYGARGMGHVHPPQHAAPVPQYAAAEAAHNPDDIGAYSAASTATTYYPRRRKASNAGAITVMIVAAILVGSLIFYVLSQPRERTVVIKAQETPVVKPASRVSLFGDVPAGSNNVVTTPTPPPTKTVKPKPPKVKPVKPNSNDAPEIGVEQPGTTPPTTPSPKPGTPEEGQDPIKKPSAGPEEGMDPIKKPAGTTPKPGGPEEGMDPIKKPGGSDTTPPKPAGKDPENLDPAAALSFETMKELANTPGKESFAILRFEDFKRTMPGKFDTQLDEFIDKKMDRLWWERIDQLMKKMKRLESDRDKTQLEVFDENNPDEKKKKLDAIKKMKEELVTSGKLLKEQMGYIEVDPPNLSSEGDLAQAATRRNKQLYENWKRITLSYIKANQGRLQWMNDT